MIKIDSKSNKKWKYWQSLTESKGIKKNNAFLITGKRLIDEAIKASIEIEAYLSAEKRSNIRHDSYQLPKDFLKELSPNHTAEDVLVVKKPPHKLWDVNTTIPSKTVLAPIGDPANLGALLRSALAFGYENIILLKEAANPYLPKAVKAASGATLYLNLFDGPSIQDLNKIASHILALDKSGKNISEVDINMPLLVGEEGPGIPDYNWQKVSIPISDQVESLNATTAISIVMYEASKKRDGTL